MKIHRFHCMFQVLIYINASVTTIMIVHIMTRNSSLFHDRPITEHDVIYNADPLIDTEGCVIPRLELFPSHLRRYIAVHKHLVCPVVKPITYRHMYTIYVNRSAVGLYYPNFSYCRYIPFEKKIGSDRIIVIRNDKSKNFVARIVAREEFVTVKCFDKNNHLIGTQQYAFIIRNRTLDRILDSRYNINGPMRPLNVLMFGFESTSRLNFIRHMDFTRRYIMEEMEAVEMLGYNKVGLNTFPNMVSILMGIPRDEMNFSGGFLDHYRFIWKDMWDMGYRTFMIEDDPDISTFHYFMRGFYRAPVLHYMMPFIMMLEDSSVEDLCYENKLEMEVMLQRIVEFIDVYRDVPHFAWSMIARYTHDDPNGLGIQDIPFYKMIKHLHINKNLENTVVVLVGDHGSRYGNIRKTHQGRIEENLPALYVILPEWFRKRYRNLYDNLRSNAHKLVNNFDIYASLQDVLNIGKGKLSYEYNGKYGVSLLRPISGKRSCDDINIPQNFCACRQYISVDSKERYVQKAAYFAVSNINLILKNVSKECSMLNLDEILSSVKFVSSTKKVKSSNSDISDFLLRIKVSPSNGIFEAEVRYNSAEKSYTIVGDVIRLDKYGDQSHCMGSHPNGKILERYCYCKQQH